MTDYDPDELVTLDVIAERRNVPVKTLYTRKRAGRLPPADLRSGRFMFWRWAQVDGVDVFGPAARGRPQVGDG